MIKCFLVEMFNTETGLNYEGRDIPYEDREKLSYRRMDTGEDLHVRHLDDCPVGAMAHTDYYEDHYKGPDGKCYSVVTPGGLWIIDSRASNCTMPNDTEHHCWCRHGEAPNFTVDKTGNTCRAGAGSILIGKYHGFLRNGFLVPA